MQTKTCKACGAELGIDQFYAPPSHNGGLSSKCKPCTCAAVRANREANKVYYRAYDRKRASRDDRVAGRKEYANTSQGRERQRRSLSKYRQANRTKVNARAVLYNAVSSGKLERQPCEICGSTARVHAHHDDYTKPLDVVWLCPKHHAWIHN